MKAWEQLSGGYIPTWDEIHSRHRNEKALFNSIGRKAKQKMEQKYFGIAKKSGDFDKIPQMVKDKLLRNRVQWEKQWGNESEQVKKLEKAYDDEMDKHLNRLYRYDQTTTSFPLNKEEITKGTVRELSFEESIQEQIKEVGGQRKCVTAEEFFNEIIEAKERNKVRGLER